MFIKEITIILKKKRSMISTNAQIIIEHILLQGTVSQSRINYCLMCCYCTTHSRPFGEETVLIK